ncbi:hypothetical protein SAMN05518845_12471 [Variovorax sp. YR750]|nr:hypothetical protein SAMN05518845_12471 [Variovorax sp. YR750]
MARSKTVRRHPPFAQRFTRRATSSGTSSAAIPPSRHGCFTLALPSLDIHRMVRQMVAQPSETPSCRSPEDPVHHGLHEPARRCRPCFQCVGIDKRRTATGLENVAHRCRPSCKRERPPSHGRRSQVRPVECDELGRHGQRSKEACTGIARHRANERTFGIAFHVRMADQRVRLLLPPVIVKRIEYHVRLSGHREHELSMSHQDSIRRLPEQLQASRGLRARGCRHTRRSDLRSVRQQGRPDRPHPCRGAPAVHRINDT